MINIFVKFCVAVAGAEFLGVTTSKLIAAEGVPISDASTVTLALLFVAVAASFTVGGIVMGMRKDNQRLREDFAELKDEVLRIRHRHQRIDRGQPLDDSTENDDVG